MVMALRLKTHSSATRIFYKQGAAMQPWLCQGSTGLPVTVMLPGTLQQNFSCMMCSSDVLCPWFAASWEMMFLNALWTQPYCSRALNGCPECRFAVKA